MPYKHRKSLIADDDNIKELIVKGYVIPFLIDGKNDTIEIPSIYSRNLP
ncbi:MAG: hypothetical protein MR902_07360 [Campylobacter sp.]|nr:hypothetical protein [Campylobacter sp.]